MKLSDRLVEPDIYNYLNYGIEGRHYRFVVDSHIEFIPGAAELRESEVRPLTSIRPSKKSTKLISKVTIYKQNNHFNLI
ncbi:hypothetical protein [Paenibacillus sp. N3.4]|uniref:hypothetical protein n=1 Tax=Paenibacillus sp. N3.4 TaxID=2603222 RepID=UPI0011CC11EE|nr:hypothetical protein [Paenibacillus sp. N3.4]TXK80400.1 hypothetical protein FU659_18500 [Paenibacillus sp. N3.4]